MEDRDPGRGDNRLAHSPAACGGARPREHGGADGRAAVDQPQALPQRGTSIRAGIPIISTVIPIIRAVIPIFSTVIPSIRAVIPIFSTVIPSIRAIIPIISTVIPSIRAVIAIISTDNRNTGPQALPQRSTRPPT
jgi:hypothetical protein